MIHIRSFTFNPLEENTYVLYDETGEGVIVDPGCYESAEQSEIKNYVNLKNLQIRYILNTHCHIDHVLGNEFVKNQYKVPLLVHALELPVLKAVKIYSSNYGFPMYHEVLPDGELAAGVPVKFGKSELQVLFVPGHSPGHVAFYEPNQKFIIGGDVLFNRSIGRTDLPGGNHQTLIDSIHRQLFILPDDVVVFPGHGPSTTIGEEKAYNPFCALSIQ
ncbi:MAG TPA: MBL fold metallo-hydrolase [Cyclobacteriaceae bacterium]|nr:MBL fold metallo-hydrolase [Cyclobacteriaceae bacterium]